MGIDHLENSEQFATFAKNFSNASYMEVTEKYDGTVALSFRSRDDGKLVFSRATKGTQEFVEISDVPTEKKWNSYRAAMQAINTQIEFFTRTLKERDIIHCEVLTGNRPNTIPYQNITKQKSMINWVIFLANGGADPDLYRRFSNFPGVNIRGLSQGESHDGKLLSKWRFLPSQLIKKFDVFDLEAIEYAYAQFKKNKRAPSEELLEMRLEIKRRILRDVVEKIKSDPFGTEVEGIVIRNRENGALTKIVDNINEDGFTRKNRRYWFWREMAHKGAIGYKLEFPVWHKGVETLFIEKIAEHLEIPLLKSISRKHYITTGFEGETFEDKIKAYMKEKGIKDRSFKRRFVKLCHEACATIFHHITDARLDFSQGKFPMDILERVLDDLYDAYTNFTILSRIDSMTTKDAIKLICEGI